MKVVAAVEESFKLARMIWASLRRTGEHFAAIGVVHCSAAVGVAIIHFPGFNGGGSVVPSEMIGIRASSYRYCCGRFLPF
jgi:hypothetical protein